MPEDLPVGYYLDNFFTILDYVDREYSDLLNSNELRFSREFRSLSLDAQRLFVRLISRKGLHFRADKLRYPEIGHIPFAAEELAEREYLQIDGPIPTEALLELLTKEEIVESVLSGIEAGGSPPKTAKRDELVSRVMECLSEDEVSRCIHQEFRIYTPLKTQEMLLYRLLFFGNLNQDLTEFVLIDLGIYRYENYRIDRSDRLFSSREMLDKTFELIAIREEFHGAREKDDTQLLLDISRRIPDAGDEPGLLRLRDRSLCGIARELERKAMLHEALGLYEQATRPPSREQRARILQRLHQFEAAYTLCREIVENPHNEEELEFARSFLPRLGGRIASRPARPLDGSGRRDKRPDNEATASARFTIPTDELALDFVKDLSVEDNVLQYFKERGVSAFYSENHLWKTLFGLAFWDIIFMPVRGVFFNRYQRGPTDFFSSDFRNQRAQAIKSRLEEIQSSRSWPEEMLKRYDEKHGIANYLVNWEVLEREELELALLRIDRNHLVRILDRFSRDTQGNKTGFPDLIRFPDTTLGYELVEVKGPGDALQRNQKRWMAYFVEWGVPFKVLNVSWR